MPWLGLVGLGVAIWLYRRLLKFPPGDHRLLNLALQIHRGAMVFLGREYRRIALVVVILSFTIALAPGFGIKASMALLGGASSSMFAGWLGMKAATRGGSRTTQAAIDAGETKALRVAFLGGSVMGLAVAALGFGGLAFILWLLISQEDSSYPVVMNAFALGASCVALFARVGGGIFTKGADVGADLAGKVEAGIPEDDARNPGVIADNVGDCVGDTAGMGADLLESYVGSLVAATAIAVGLADRQLVLFPFTVAGIGIITSVLGLLMVHFLVISRPHAAIRIALWITGGLFLLGTAAVEWILLGQWHLVWAVAAGVVSGTLIGVTSDYFTTGKPVKEIARAAEQGAGPNVIIGLAVGMRSVIAPILLLCGAIAVAHAVGSLYGISLASVGMLGTLALVMAADAYGPIADNAGGIAEMSGADDSIREITDALDSMGNTTAAIGKGFAIGSAALTSLALFSAYQATISRTTPVDLSLTNVHVVIGLFIGVAAPFAFAAMSMQAVGRVAQRLVKEIRRQFHEINGLLEGTADPVTERCIAIATDGALREMILPGIAALLLPVAVGFMLGPAALGGLLAGSVACGVIMGIFMANGGGAWDNAKKWIEAGHLGGKGSDAHAAAVIGDTIGDPFKDTAGPSMNILIKLMAVVSLFLAPVLLA